MKNLLFRNYPGFILALVSVVYLSFFAYNGWIPHDQGTLAQSAERVLNGELPHRDFDDVYTGGLSFFHAAGFWMLGTSMASIRTLLLISSIGFVWALNRVACRCMPAAMGGLVTLTCLAWSLPNYFEGMPSWYLMFLSVLGICATLKYFDTGSRYWLFLAGVCGGLGAVIKIVALFYIAAIAFAIVYRAQIRNISSEASKGRFSWGMFAIALTMVLLWLALASLMVRRHATLMTWIQFILPSLAVGTVLVVQTSRCTISAGSIVQVIRELSLFVTGIALPIVVFLIPYATTGSLWNLYRGVFIQPFVRVDAVVFPLPNSPYLFLEVPVLFLLLLGVTRFGNRDRMICALATPILLIGLYLCWFYFYFDLALTMVRLSTPCVAMVASWMLLFDRSLSDQRKSELYTVLTVSSLTTLWQFPFSAPIYFCFVAPLAFLTLQITCASQRFSAVRVQRSLLLVSLMFGVVLLNHFQFFDDPGMAQLDPAVNLLELPRGGLYLTARDTQKYEQLVQTIQQKSPPSSSIYAGPDCPEVYFLSERKNPTRTLFELFDEPDPGDSNRLRFILKHDLPVVVINLEPSHSRKFSQPFLDKLVGHFPNSVTISNFIVLHK